MRKGLLVVLLVMGLTGPATAQKGDWQFRMLAEAGFPTGAYSTGPSADEYRTGSGLYAKALYGQGKSGRLSLATGYARFKNQVFSDLSVRTLPVLLGYQFRIGDFYLEPQAGYGVLSAQEYDYIGERYVRYSVGAAYFSLGGGYEYERWDAGVRFQSGHAVNDMPASFNSRYFQFVGLHVGYTLWQRPDNTSSQ